MLFFLALRRKPIVICNFFNRINERLIDAGLALECKNSFSLIETINHAIELDPSYEKKRNDFIKKYFYKGDGLASERICESLLNLTKNS